MVIKGVWSLTKGQNTDMNIRGTGGNWGQCHLAIIHIQTEPPFSQHDYKYHQLHRDTA